MKTAMILAAGRGERLKPLTNKIPKAMCQVHGRPLIEHHVAKLARDGFERIVINHAYLGSQIRRHLGSGSYWNVEICYAPEPPGGLETGGGIYNALPLLGKEPFLAVNADIVTDYDFKKMRLDDEALITLLLVDNPVHKKIADFGLVMRNRVSNFERTFCYAGIACYHPQVFETYKPGRYSLVPMLRKLADENQITGQVHKGLWVDIGSIEGLRVANDQIGCSPTGQGWPKGSDTTPLP